MELSKKHDSMPLQSWTRRSTTEDLRSADYHYELRTWLQHAVLQAEKSRDSRKKDKFLTLLREL